MKEFSQNNQSIDYKNVELLGKFINPNGRVLSRRTTGLSVKNQRRLSMAIKRARFLGLLPYVSK